MGANLELNGHTDDTGDTDRNMALSIARATSVKEFLNKKCGFPVKNITVHGFGAKEPVSDNNTEEGRLKNRRIEIIFKMPELSDSQN